MNVLDSAKNKVKSKEATMVKEIIKGKAILSLVAAAAFCGGAIYATGKSLEYMFRDVDPKRIENDTEESVKNENERDNDQDE